MKGLLLKDFYVAKKNMWYTVVTIILFLAIGIFTDNNFFTVYSIIIASIIPITMIAYDEKSGWNIYSITMPYTRRQLVSAKYLFAVIVLIAGALLSGGALAIKSIIENNFNPGAVFTAIAALFAGGIISPCIMLPTIFKWGVEKGRIIYMIVIMFVSVAVASFIEVEKLATFKINSYRFMFIVFLLAILAFLASWWLSVRFYEKREL